MVENKGPANLTELLLYAKPGSLILSEPGKSPEWSCLRGLNKRASVQKPKFRVLSLDGGGILGLAAAMMVEKLEADLGKPANQIFDMFIGTSTGGILSVGLAAGIPAKELVELYRTKGDVVFDSKFMANGYSKEGLTKLLEEQLSAVNMHKMKDLKVRCGVQTCLILEADADAIGMVLNNWSGLYDDLSLVEACLCTSSRVEMYQAQKVNIYGHELNFVDGGVSMDNPVLLGKTYAEEFVENPKENIFMLSFSTGQQIFDIDGREQYNQGFIKVSDSARWGANGLEYCANSNIRQAALAVAETLPFEDFYRFNPESLSGMDWDNIKKRAINKIEEAGNAMIEGSEYKNLLKRLKEMERYPVEPLHQQ